MPNLKRNSLILCVLATFFGFNAFAAKFEKAVTGEDAKALYELAGDPGDSDYKGPNELSAGCHYDKPGNDRSLQFCDSEIGFINSPVREILSRILLANRTPEFVENEHYAIGVHFICVSEPAYSCDLEDLSDYNARNAEKLDTKE
jgi:hypothetical protein